MKNPENFSEQVTSLETKISQPEFAVTKYVGGFIRAYRLWGAIILAALALSITLSLPAPASAWGTWTQISTFPVYNIGWHKATLLQNGQVLAVGGFGNFDPWYSRLYDPVTRAWHFTKGNLTDPRVQFHTVTLLPNGKVLVVGGGSPTVSCELYNPALGKWIYTGFVNYARSEHTATLLQNGQVLVAGGRDKNAEFRRTCELYDPTTESWNDTNYLLTARCYHTATLIWLKVVK
ncbi:MAG: hypothetical protein NTY36_14375 [Deltaproteobacteria bacterium]|nr:hypothetical protein [Deltaproteobacteria bacterium]